MSQPYGFSWIDKPLLAALARPSSLEDLKWLRDNGLEVLLSLTEEPMRRDWINDAGLMVHHEPITDFTAPSREQFERCISVLERAHAKKMGVAVHCAAGKGRTGTVLAGFLVAQGSDASSAISRVRELRPGSIETNEQEEAVRDLARHRAASSHD